MSIHLYLSQVESEGKSDIEVADESWLSYKKRNDSFFVDLFGGQFKSTLVCPVCSKVRPVMKSCETSNGCTCTIEYI